MNRIDVKFKELKKQKRPALVVYITAGYPTLPKTKELVFELEKNGADIIELGIPFSDPLADGPTIQAASYEALKKKITLRNIIHSVEQIRQHSQVPVVFMTYYNPVYRFGVEEFVKASHQAGADGVIVPDLPPEEAGRLIKISKKIGFATIFLLAPTSINKRIKLISKFSTGFIYYVSLTGVTGARKKLPSQIKNDVAKINRLTNKPVCVGFGISNPSQAKHITKSADGVIVGSAVIKVIQENLEKPDMVKRVGSFIRSLSDAI